MLSSSVIDQRGRRCRLFGFVQLPWKARTAIGRDVHQRIWRRVWAWLAPVYVLGYVVGFLASAVPTSVLMRTTPWHSMSIVPLMLGVLTWFAAVNTLGYCTGQWLAHRVFRARIVDAFLAELRCPACAYDLAGVEATVDGCTVCPECGAAWRLARGA